MNSPKHSLQDEYLETLKQEHTRLSIYLVNGIQLNGWIAEFDRYSILLGSPVGTQLIFKQNISTILPAVQVNKAPDPADTVSGEVSVNVGRSRVARPLTLRKKRQA